MPYLKAFYHKFVFEKILNLTLNLLNNKIYQSNP